MIGKVRFFDNRNGWGFLSCEELGKDVFCHFSDCSEGFRDQKTGKIILFDGDKVQFDIGKDPKGRDKAVNVRPQKAG